MNERTKLMRSAALAALAAFLFAIAASAAPTLHESLHSDGTTAHICAVTSVAFAQEAATNNSPPASSAEVEQLRQQVQSLTELVKQLQQQVQNQPQPQANPAASPMLPENPEPQSTPAEAAASPSKPTNAPQLIPTDDASVVA